jgi:hypothetical protein
MTTDTLSPRTERQVEQNVQEIDGYIAQMRTAVEQAKTYLDNGGDPVEVDKAMDLRINYLNGLIAKVVEGQTHTVARALADHYGVPYLKKHSAMEIAPKIAANLLHEIRIDEDYAAVSDAARVVRRRAERIEEAGRTLRYWASEKFEADDSQAWRMSGDTENVQAMLKHWGKVYCQARGLDGIMVYPQDTDLGNDTVEEALERVGQYALHRTLAGMGRFGGSESSLMQIRLGDLMGHLYEDFAHKVVIKMALGAISTGTATVSVGFSYDDASEYQPGYRTGGGRTAFDALTA